ncbi:MAG: hypothetical protein QOI66_2223 [Myxococcales bacterium]|jgi:hypothetical protein|nr:hypothetical protein [Myxococcales bacterium]
MMSQRLSLLLVLTLAISLSTACSSKEATASLNDADPGNDGQPIHDAKPPADADASDDGLVARLLAQLQAARATWADAKASCPTYHYDSVRRVFPFGGCFETGVEISQDQPTRRRYGNCDGTPVIGDSWDETGTSIGTHPWAAAALTVERLFDDCQANVSGSDPSTNDLVLTVGPMGVPQICGHTPKGCVDDCFVGFEIDGFACGPLPPASPVDGGAGDAGDGGAQASDGAGGDASDG